LKHHQKDIDDAEIDKRITEALDNVGLSEAIDKMPSELSGGMVKRIGMARTIIVKPEIILYDEPTSGLDTITAREISELIVSVQKNIRPLRSSSPMIWLVRKSRETASSSSMMASSTPKEPIQNWSKAKTNGCALFLINQNHSHGK